MKTQQSGGDRRQIYLDCYCLRQGCQSVVVIGKLNEAISHRTSAARTVHAIFAQHLLHKSISSRHGDANFFKPFIVNVEGKVPHIKPKVKM